ncbi:MAG TPA: hypothetical protein VK934_03385 [Fimbriimonas sp.]|nr:hypothetical protein [Fimbriimonas sp.]
MSNLKQCAVGMAIYASDNDDRVPRCAKWMDDLIPYTKNENIFRCPVLKEGSFGYAMSKYANAGKMETPDADKKPLLFETRELGRSVSQYLPLYPAPLRHNGMANVAYFDTHVRAIRMEKE